MGLPGWLIGLIDPASREFERDRRSHGLAPPRGRSFRGGAVMGPGIPGGARQATPEELAIMSVKGDRRRRHEEGVLAQVLAENGEQLRSTARELLANGRAGVAIAAVTLDAELLTFWRGDRILRIRRSTSETSAGSSLVRLPRRDRPDSEATVALYLASSLANQHMNG
jgi:hypothetical protein